MEGIPPPCPGTQMRVLVIKNQIATQILAIEGVCKICVLDGQIGRAGSINTRVTTPNNNAFLVVGIVGHDPNLTGIGFAGLNRLIGNLASLKGGLSNIHVDAASANAAVASNSLVEEGLGHSCKSGDSHSHDEGQAENDRDNFLRTLYFTPFLMYCFCLAYVGIAGFYE